MKTMVLGKYSGERNISCLREGRVLGEKRMDLSLISERTEINTEGENE